jgi:hypothetical protein
MSKSKEQLDEDHLFAMMETFDDVFARIFCEARVSDLPPEDDEESDDE